MQTTYKPASPAASRRGRPDDARQRVGYRLQLQHLDRNYLVYQHATVQSQHNKCRHALHSTPQSLRSILRRPNQLLPGIAAGSQVRVANESFDQCSDVVRLKEFIWSNA